MLSDRGRFRVPGAPVCCRWQPVALHGRVSLEKCCCPARCDCSAFGFFPLDNTCSLPSSDASGEVKAHARRAAGRAGSFSERLSHVVHLDILLAALGSPAACTRPGRQDGRGLASTFALDACVATPDGGAPGCGDPGRRSMVMATLVPARSKRFGHSGERGGQSSPKIICKMILRG